MKRVIVIGSGGAGKSTFSRRLGDRLKIEVIHLDQLYWKPGWIETPAGLWAEIVKQHLTRDTWIMDGNFGGTRSMRMAACDTVIFLDTSRWVCIYRILKRVVIYRNKRRPDMAEGCYERLDWDFIKWVWKYSERGRPKVMAEVERFANKKLVVLKSKGDVESFLARLG